MKKNTQAVMQSALEKARTSSIFETGRQSGLSDEEIGRQILGSDPEKIKSLAKTIKTTVTIDAIGEIFGLTMENNIAFKGYAAIVQFYTDEPEAKEFEKFLTDVKTVGDVYRFVIEKNHIDSHAVEYLPGYDEKIFNELLNTPILKARGFSFGS